MVDKTKFQKLSSKFESSTGNSIPDEVINKVGDYLMNDYVTENKNFTVRTVAEYIKSGNLVQLTEKAKRDPETEKKSYWNKARSILNRLGVQRAKRVPKEKKIEIQNGKIIN